MNTQLPTSTDVLSGIAASSSQKAMTHPAEKDLIESFDHLGAILYSQAVGGGLGHEDALDAVQEAFLGTVGVIRYSKLNFQNNVRGLSVKIAKWKFTDIFKERIYHDCDALPADTDRKALIGPDEMFIERAAMIADIDAALNSLPAHYRKVIVLCHLREKSVKEAADELGLSKGKIRGWLPRAREALRKKLHAYDPEN